MPGDAAVPACFTFSAASSPVDVVGVDFSSLLTETRHLGVAKVTFAGYADALQGVDFKKRPVSGPTVRFRVGLPSEPALLVDVISWNRRDADGPVGAALVRGLEGREGGCPRNYSHRLGIYPLPVGDAMSATRVMELKLVGGKRERKEETTWRRASISDICLAARVVDAEGELRRWGAAQVGSRAIVGWPAMRRDAIPAATYSRDEVWTPVAALLLCVVLPVFHGLSLPS